MKKFLLTISLLLTLGFSFQGVAAQVDAPEVTGASIEDIEGLESAYGRSYSIDIEALMEDPDFDIAAMDPADMAGNLGIQGYTFDSEDSAKNFLEETKKQMDESIESDEMAEMEDMEFTVGDLEDFDKDGYYVEMKMTGEIEINSAMIIFVDGDTIFQVSAIAGTMDESKAQAYDAANFIADAEVQSEEVTFNADGTSTGGVFDRMPAADEELLGELVPSMDLDLSNPEAGQ